MNQQLIFEIERKMPENAIKIATWKVACVKDLIRLFSEIRQEEFVAYDLATLCGEVLVDMIRKNYSQDNELVGNSVISFDCRTITYTTSSNRKLIISRNESNDLVMRLDASENPSRFFYTLITHFLGEPYQKAEGLE